MSANSTRLFGRTLVAMKRKNGARVKAHFVGKTVRIWSAEHMAWWRAERSGYTSHIEAAGIYTFDNAWDATNHCGPEKRIIFYLAPVQTGIAT